ncbi:class I SAM-dependent methyltransferase [Prochlorococcus marinus]|uniref:class I SAM-dependent methyltransferase n=1 Tax=Prochlorococcus marinus TaxID=1219 RepID=UPI0022B5C00B|nr:class I SAM-dependent methyltransferase [Prochlorococcus marinus]
MQNKKNWKDIWSKKAIKSDKEIKLSDLIKLNGFDTGVGSYSEKNWMMMVEDCIKKIKVENESCIFEIGCGSGAFLYAASKLKKIQCQGIDYSESLIEIAKKVIPNGKFQVLEAIDTEIKEESIDAVISHSVFQYFPNLNYAFKVIQKIIPSIKKGGSICLMDLNDVEKKEIYHKDRSLNYESSLQYEEAFKGLDHLFFSKRKLEDYLRKLGLNEISTFKHAYKNYGNSKYRFNIIGRK